MKRHLILDNVHSLQSLPLAFLFLVLVAASARAGSATWSANPLTNDWNTAANWMPNTVPNEPADTATFALSNVTDVSISPDTTVNGVIFQAGASQFTLTAAPDHELIFSGNGISNASSVIQTFVSDVDIDGNRGIIRFTGNATAGSSSVFINKGSIGGSEEGGLTRFFDTASAGSASFIATGASSNGFLGGQVKFFDNSTADHGTFTVSGPTDNGPNGGMVHFFDSASAGNGAFTANGGTFDHGSIVFHVLSSAGNGRFITNGGSATLPLGGETIFQNFSTGDHGRFVVNGGSAAGASGGVLTFEDSATAASSTIIANGGTANGATGGEINFFGGFHTGGKAGNATIIVRGGVNGGGGADCGWGDLAEGDSARVEVFGNGTITLSARLLTFGSLEGDGTVFGGPGMLSIGSNDLSTSFSGTIDGPLSLIKIGAGTFRLNGANTYGGSTVISTGTVIVNNTTGSATSKAKVLVNAGTLGGKGIINGAVFVGTGSGAGAFLSPGVSGGQAATLTIQSGLTFHADGTYICRLDTKKSAADQVTAKGVTIESSAQFQFKAGNNKNLSEGMMFVVINNTSAQPIAGQFANLADGSILKVGRNSFQVDYQGGDGNDLSLIVIQ
jgi:autotransporter-associated beta strand protein